MIHSFLLFNGKASSELKMLFYESISLIAASQMTDWTIQTQAHPLGIHFYGRIIFEQSPNKEAATVIT